MQSDHDVHPSYFGFVETCDDAVMLIQACLQESLSSVQRRPTPSERPSVAHSGHVFIYEENASGIQRWTDGRHWSPSRMLGDFFVYGDRSTSANELHTMDNDNRPLSVEDGREDWHQRLYGPLMRSFNINAESLVKKTINIKDIDDSGAIWHLVSYYRPVDVLQGRLQTPSMNHGFVLPLWHGQRHSSRAYGTLSHAHHAGGHYVSPMGRQWHSSLSTQHHVEVSWPMSIDFGHHDTNVLQDPVSELAFAANGTMPWSTDGRLDASLFEFDMCIPENSPTGIGSIQIPIAKM